MVDVGTPIISVGDPSEAPAPPHPPLRRPSPTPTSGWRRRPAPRRPRRCRRSTSPTWTSPTRRPPARWRASPSSVATRPTGVRSVGPAAARPRRPPTAGAQTQLQLQGAFAPAAPSRRGRAPATSRRCRPRPRRGARSRPRRGARPAVRAGRAQRRTSAGEAAGAQAGQGPRRRPDDAHRLRCRPGRSRVPMSRVPPRAVAPAVHGSGCPSRPPPGERETREPIKGVRKMMAQAMSQSAFTSPARHRVDHRRRDGARCSSSSGSRRVASSRTSRYQPAAGARACRPDGDEAHPGDQLVLGRGRAGGRLQALRQPRHRRGHPAWPGRAERQGRRRDARCSTSPARSAG